ncbi:PhoH family protein [Bacteroidales bacterium OttesenSCG-928-K03]|nr:PhoH family protein [Odoribacter sp. OttesenSCG-928-L07]MDL2239445.1 PhoH family protein [Bacteroidales bacterium OttesenSCG-928-L14]MDL2240566.1 PhoH family protein [Bacteroidales bacterium OttesenSCG-928-K22]MDL2242652.1 PhoH family protein [Bacteroidales bacterium OttesenSCG-928-K03]
MSESIINLSNYDPIAIYGTQDVYLTKIKQLFPKLKIIARGELIKVVGAEEDRIAFEKYIDMLLLQIDSYGQITEKDLVECLVMEEKENLPLKDNDLILYGKNGNLIKARTKNQKVMVKSIDSNDLLFAIGPAGSGKTFTAVALAVRALKNKEIRRIILTRPAVEAGENLGFLPGDLKEKLDPYLRPLYDALNEMLPSQKLKSYLEDGTIEIAPLAFMRGRTLNNAYAILDEAQNATDKQLKMFLTRMGEDSKFIITGDITQIDLPKKSASGLLNADKILKNIEGIDFIHLNEKDIVRHKLVTSIVKAYEKYDIN